MKVQGGNAPSVADMKTEIQKAHFDFGYNQLDYVTYSNDQLKDYGITKESMMNQEKTRKSAIANMRQANFRLPNSQVMKTEESTYKNKISDNA